MHGAARAFWIVWAVVLTIKLALASTLAPFGDEAFYWQESRHLDWAFSDLPPLTAVLIRVGETLCGHGEFGLRAMFLLLGAVLPLQVRASGTRLFGAAVGDRAAMLWLLLPLGGSLGVLALPDVPLLGASVWALDALERAARDDRLRHWLALGLALALAWLTHYRAAMLLAAGLAFLVVTPRGRGIWARRGLWLALGTSMLGLVPLAIYNARHDGSGLRFQLLERHPWSFHADALVQPVEQAIVCTPLLYALLLWALWRCWRRRGEGTPWDLFATAGGAVVLGYFVLGLFADDLRFRAHWPLPGYVPALLVLPLLVGEAAPRRGADLWGATVASAALGAIATLTYLALTAWPAQTARLAALKLFPEHFVGWREAAARTRSLLEQENATGTQQLLVADNFLLAAELDFQLAGTRPVYVLDHPLNTKHGRAVQLAQWKLDEGQLREREGAPVLLVVQDSAGRERERPAWQDSLPQRIGDLQRLDALDLFEGRQRFTFYRGKVQAR
jgi:4-amino-4-deoxy-L-arabinose transferase-like glycosyltransferase